MQRSWWRRLSGKIQPPTSPPGPLSKHKGMLKVIQLLTIWLQKISRMLNCSEITILQYKAFYGFYGIFGGVDWLQGQLSVMNFHFSFACMCTSPVHQHSQTWLGSLSQRTLYLYNSSNRVNPQIRFTADIAESSLAVITNVPISLKRILNRICVWHVRILTL